MRISTTMIDEQNWMDSEDQWPTDEQHGTAGRRAAQQQDGEGKRRGEEGRGEKVRETTTANKETQQQEAHTARNAGASRETGHDRMDQRDGPRTKTQQPATKKNTATTRDDEQATRTQNQQTKRGRERERPGASEAQE